MFSLLKDLSDKADKLQGRGLAIILSSIFLFFLLLGISLNYAIRTKLTNNEDATKNRNTSVITQVEEIYEEGIINYVDPRLYPQENISYYLADREGNQIVLLRSKDQKLQVSEGLYVRVYGREAESFSTGEKLIEVTRVILKR